MRRLLVSFAAVSLFATQVQAADCLRPMDHVAMDVTALKTQLMVTALTCKADERYNAFVTKYKPDLAREDKSLGTYFSRSYGRSGVKQRDDYVTQLANSQSQVGLKQGSYFCDDNVGAFDEVMALKNSAELQEYAAGRAGVQPISTVSCAGTAVPEHKTTRRRRS